MIEENNNIFLTGGDTLLCLTATMHKKDILQHSLGDPFGTYVS